MDAELVCVDEWAIRTNDAGSGGEETELVGKEFPGVNGSQPDGPGLDVIRPVSSISFWLRAPNVSRIEKGFLTGPFPPIERLISYSSVRFASHQVSSAQVPGFLLHAKSRVARWRTVAQDS